MDISVIIPTFQEETYIKETLASLAKAKAYAAKRGIRSEILVVDSAGHQHYVDTTKWISPSIPAGVFSITYPDSLPDGHYIWTIKMLDSFEDEAESVEAVFYVSHSFPL